MAVDFHERETSLLPSSQLLTHDDISSTTESESNLNEFGSCGSSSSGLSTPVGSEMGSSTNTESDEHDFIDELTRQMAEYMLQEDDENPTSDSLSVKPKWSDCNLDSKDHHSQRLMRTPHKAKPFSAHLKNSNVGYKSSTVNQFDQLKDQQSTEHQSSVCWGRQGEVTGLTQRVKPKKQHHYHVENKGRACGFGNGGRVRPHQQTGSGMRAIFLGRSGSKSGSGGTGVFLPRGTSNPSESQKKSACSTVLIPARVLQALKLHFDDLSPSTGSGASNAYHLQHDDVMAGRFDMHSSQQKRQAEPQIQPEMLSAGEMGLPREWTY